MSEIYTSEGPVIMDPPDPVVVERPVVTTTMMDMISKAAASGNVDVVAALIQMKYRDQDREREIEANRALVDLRNDIPQIERKGTVNTGKGTYAYAEMEDIDEAIRPHRIKHGFTFTFRTIEETNDYLLMEGMLIHKATGWVFRSQRREPIIIGPGQNRAQAGGTSQTYAMRYLKISMLDLVLKGEDTDGVPRGRVQRGPVTPPSMDPKERQEYSDRVKKAMSNQWAIAQEDGFKRLGEYWTIALCEAFATAPTSEDLEALVDLVRENVNNLDKLKQKDIGEALMKAREGVAQTEQRFDFLVRQATGETDGELFAEAAGWMREFLEYWRSAQGAEERENLLHHNADALAAVRSIGTPLLKEVDEWQRDQSAEKRRMDPLMFSAVQPPMNNGKPNWSAWLRVIQDDMTGIYTEEDFNSWLDAQRVVIADADILPRMTAIGIIAKAIDRKGGFLPVWLREMILPIAAATSHPEWAACRIAELYWITNKEDFEQAVALAKPRMIVMRTEDTASFELANAAFSERHRQLEG